MIHCDLESFGMAQSIRQGRLSASRRIRSRIEATVMVATLVSGTVACRVSHQVDLRDSDEEEPLLEDEEDQGALGFALTAERLTHRLVKGEYLFKDGGLVSPDLRFSAVLRGKGQFEFYSEAKLVWTNGLKDKNAWRLVLDANGDLRVVDRTGKALWSAGTAGSGATVLEVTDEGQLVLSNAAGQAVWRQGQCCAKPEPPGETRPHLVGRWTPPFDWPLVPLHTALLPDGKVYSYGGDAKGARSAKNKVITSEWDPAKGRTSEAFRTVQISSERSDVFCSAATLIAATGELLVAGGTAFDTEKPNAGDAETRIYNSRTGQIAFGPTMAHGRWYPTVTTLPDGRILTQGGRDGAFLPVPTPEVYEPGPAGGGRWRTLFKATSADIISKAESRWWYPRSFVDTDGKIFGLTGNYLYKLDPTGDGGIAKLAELPADSNDRNAPAVMFQPGRILQLGGGKGRRGALLIETNGNAGQPKVIPLQGLSYPRAWGNTTLLANGEVLITGGSASPNQLIELPRHAEIWNPSTRNFRKAAAETIPRLYHATALLLPDGSVLVGGGGSPGPVTNTNGQIFYPPYLFNENGVAPRPVWEQVPKRIRYDQPILASLTGTDAVSRVTMMRLGSVTHSFDFDQRFLELQFRQNGNELTIASPNQPALAPPGYYMLFAFNAQKVPSVARIVALGTPTPDDTLTGGEQLKPGERLVSASGATLDLTRQGELVTRVSGQVVWSSTILKPKIAKAALSPNGHFELMNGANTVIWTSGSEPNPGGALRLTEQGDIIVTARDGKILWQASQCCQ